MRSLSLLLLCLCLTLPSCAKKPVGLDPTGVKLWQANEAIVVVGTFQHTAIEFNKVQKCPTPTTCHPLLSDANTRLVIDASAVGIKTIAATPDGWRAAALQALDVAAQKLDAAGRQQLAAYLTAARTALAAIQ